MSSGLGITATFSPLAFPMGRVLFNIITTAPPPTHLALCPFEVYRQPFIVVGLADGKFYQEASDSNGKLNNSNESNGAQARLPKDGLETLLESRQKLASDFSTGLVHEALIFDCDIDSQSLPEGLTAIPPSEKSKTTTIKTVMCDLTSHLLAEMASFARSLQELPSIETPRVPRHNIQRPLARYSVSAGLTAADSSQPTPPSLNDHDRNEHRMSMPAHLLANLGSRSSTPEARSMSPPSGRSSPPTAQEGIGSAPVSPPSRAIDRQRPLSRDRASMQGFGSNSLLERERTKCRGRIHIVIGSLYLLAGRWPDAVKELVDGATAAKINSDHAWHAKALDCLLVICLLYAWSNVDFQIPPLLRAAIDKPGSGTIKSSKETPMTSYANLNNDSPLPPRDVTLQHLSTMLPEVLTTIQNLQSRAWTFSEDKLPQLIFSETGIRFSRLLMLVDRSGGKLTDTNLDFIVLDSKARHEGEMERKINLSPQRAEIASFLLRSFPSTDTDESLSIADRTRILAGIAFLLGEFGYRRRKAYILKELLQGLIPALVEARKRGAAEMGVHPAASLASLDAALVGTKDVALRLLHSEDEAGIQSFLKMVCRSYGIRFSLSEAMDEDEVRQDCKQNEKQPMTSVRSDTVKIIERAVRQVSSKSFGSADLKLDVLRLCINVCEALPDLEGVLLYSAELLRTSGSGIAPGPDDNDGSCSLPIEDQLRLWNNIARTVGVGRQLGREHLAADYWDEFLIRGIETVPSASNSPRPHAKGELDAVTKATTDSQSGPFLYNPFGQTSKAKQAKPLMVVGEETIFRVTLQNLYDFDLDIESIRLTLDKDSCDTLAQSVIVGPYRTQSVYLHAIPAESGSLIVDGCMVTIRGCHERWFPLFVGPWLYKPGTKASQSVAEDVPSAIASQSAEKRGSKAPQGPTASSLALDVIPPLPNVVLRTTTLPQSAIMLLEGETRTFAITLFNASKSIPADLVLLTFEDSMAAQLQAAKELPQSELYELSLASSRKPLRWLKVGREKSPSIDPGEELTLEIELDGRPGLSNANIQVSYAYIGVPLDSFKDRFYTRQISVPLTVTVNASIDISKTDILPFSTTFAWQNQQRSSLQSRPPSAKKPDTPSDKIRSPSSMNTRMKSGKLINNENRFQSLLSRIGLTPGDIAHCLLCLDCRNSWPSPLSVSIQVRPFPTGNTPLTSQSPKSESTNARLTYTVHETLQPGHTKRILLLLPRLRLANAHHPIPALDPKQQFVVSSSPQATYEAQFAARENHWYREALLSSLNATWTEESTSRTGMVNLRNIRLSARMVEALKLPELEINMKLAFTSPPSGDHSAQKTESENLNHEDEDEDATACQRDDHGLLKQTGPTAYTVPLSQLLTLTTNVTNHSQQPIHPLLRLQPLLKPPNGAHSHHIALDTSRKFLIHGLLQQALPVLQSGESMSIETVVSVLGRGTFSVGGVVEEVRIFTDEGDDIQGERERRVWRIEEPLEITGVDQNHVHEGDQA
ncbi:MAG: hypothetical protein Q9205_004422 [Flavoplaca limonia]